MKILILLWHI